MLSVDSGPSALNEHLGELQYPRYVTQLMSPSLTEVSQFLN